METQPTMPDVASLTTDLAATRLDWVGMSDIQLPLRIPSADGTIMQVPAKASAFVSLDKTEARGIHMSRLYKICQEELTQKTFTWPLINDVVKQFLISHADLSTGAKVSLDFEAMILRPALKSENRGWRSYPVQLWAECQKGVKSFGLEVTVTYSSTCPASAALARQLIQQNFRSHFRAGAPPDFNAVNEWLGSPSGILATPHAQRSFAKVRVELQAEEPNFGFTQLIDVLEEALQTPVQTVVKREDEQEFALRNGQNLMFCEDAARRLKMALQAVPGLKSFQGQVKHVESLHPHDAMSFFSN